MGQPYPHFVDFCSCPQEIRADPHIGADDEDDVMTVGCLARFGATPTSQCGNPLPDPIVILCLLDGRTRRSHYSKVLSNPDLYEGFSHLHAAGCDIIVFDQRGVGFSEPQLPYQLGQAYVDVLDFEDENDQDLTIRQAGEAVAASLDQCGKD